MGAFDLPRGEFELLLKKDGEAEWKSVMFTDYIDMGEIADAAEMWSKNYKVLAARYNGREVTIPTNYKWELRYKDEVFGEFKTRAEAVEEMNRRKIERRKDKTVRVGLPYFVKL